MKEIFREARASARPRRRSIEPCSVKPCSVKPWFSRRGADLLRTSRGDRSPESWTQPRNRAEQLHGVSLGRLHLYPAAGPEIQEGFLAGRGDQDDQGLWRADRGCRRSQDRRISHRDLLSFAPGASCAHASYRGGAESDRPLRRQMVEKDV